MAGRFLGKTPDINYLVQDFLFSHQHALKFETVGLKHKAGECTLRIMYKFVWIESQLLSYKYQRSVTRFHSFIPVVGIPGLDAWPLQWVSTSLGPSKDPVYAMSTATWMSQDRKPAHSPLPSSLLRLPCRCAVPLLTRRNKSMFQFLFLGQSF